MIMNNNDFELFKVIMSENNKVKLVFSDDLKALISVEEIEKALKDDVDLHLAPIINKILDLVRESYQG